MRTLQPRTMAGVTLIELLFTLAVLGVLTSISMPALGSWMQKTQQQTARDAMFVSLNHARSDAILRARDVSLCPSRDHARCDDSAQWQHGWIVFADDNGNGKRDDGEALIEVGEARAGVGIASTEGRKHVSFRADGGAPGTNMTMTFCDKRGADQATALVLSNAGRARQAKASAAQAASACATLPSA